MGEEKHKVLLQVFIEELIPILIAAIIGILISGSAGNMLTAFLMNTTGEDAEAVVESISDAVTAQNPAYTDASVTSLYKHKTNSLHIDSGMNVHLTALTSICYFVFIISPLIVTVFLQLKLVYTKNPHRVLLQNR